MISNNIKVNLVANINNIDSNKLSPRFKKAVDEFILVINNLSNTKNSHQVNQILITLTYFLKETVAISTIIDNYSEFNDTSVELFGGLNGFFKKLRYCSDKKALTLLIHARIDYFIKKLTLFLTGEEFPFGCTDKEFKAEFAKVLKLIIVNLHDNYQFKNFAGLYMGELDFQNYQFNECNFMHSKWVESNIKSTVFNKCNLAYASLAIAGEDTQFINCNMTMAGFVHANIKGISFYDCSFQTTHFNSELELSEYASFYKEGKLITYENLLNEKQKCGWKYIRVHSFSFTQSHKSSDILLIIKKHIFIESLDKLTYLEKVLSEAAESKSVSMSLSDKSKLTLVTECLIRPDVLLNSDNVCGILNNNVLQLYYADCLWAWLIKNPICPKTRVDICELWKMGRIFNKQQINRIVEKRNV